MGRRSWGRGHVEGSWGGGNGEKVMGRGSCGGVMGGGDVVCMVMGRCVGKG